LPAFLDKLQHCSSIKSLGDDCTRVDLHDTDHQGKGELESKAKKGQEKILTGFSFLCNNGLCRRRSQGDKGRIGSTAFLSPCIIAVDYFLLFLACLSGVSTRMESTFRNLGQCCQISLDTMYQNGGKYTNLPLNQQNAIKYTQYLYYFPTGHKM
jgi:hypothetical protein